MIGITTKRYSSIRPSSISCEGTSTPPIKIFLPCSCFSLSISSRGFVRTILVFLSSALPNDREKTILLRESNARANSFDALVIDWFLATSGQKGTSIDRFYGHRRAGQHRLARGACSIHISLHQEHAWCGRSSRRG